MDEAVAAGRLLDLVRTALAEADEQDETLVAALLAECIEMIERRLARRLG